MPTPTTKPKRRWLPRWSMRAMFLGVTIFCVWFGLLSRSANEQKRAVEALRSSQDYDIRILDDYETDILDDGSVDPIGLTEVLPPGPDWLRDVMGIDYFADVVFVEFTATRIPDDDLQSLWNFSRLRSLRVYDLDSMTDVGLGYITRLTSLNELELAVDQLSALPPEIGRLTNLRQLRLWNNKLTTLPPEIGKLTNLTLLDLGKIEFTTLPREVGQLVELKHINLLNNPITDMDLDHLKSLTRLEFIDIRGTKVTKKGVADLKRALPNCEIESDFD